MPIACVGAKGCDPMTVLAPPRPRTTGPRAFAVPVVREVPVAPLATGLAFSW
jgi:hypothetical protein